MVNQKPDGSFQDVSMNSFNHYAYGAIGDWLYRYVAGIRLDSQAPGYKHFFLQPHVGGGLTTASAELKTLYGTIQSEWRMENGKLIYSCLVPANTSATVSFDNTVAKDIVLNDQPLLKNKSIRSYEDNRQVKIEIGSGHYVFALPAN